VGDHVAMFVMNSHMATEKYAYGDCRTLSVYQVVQACRKTGIELCFVGSSSHLLVYVLQMKIFRDALIDVIVQEEKEIFPKETL
jgi:hypothetical protein